MRDYAKVVPTFWTGDTGKALRKRGSEAMVVGLYLMSSPISNMLGLYYQPILYMAHETGLGLEGARKGLEGAIAAGFCRYDEESEMVWIPEMAKYQIASELKATDNRCAGIQKDYDALPVNPFLGEFFDKYQTAFHLTKKRGCEAPVKPLPSQEQEQEQEQKQDSLGAIAPLSPASPTTLDLLPPLTLDGTPDQPPALPPCPLKQLVAMYAARLPELPKPRYELWKDGEGAEAMRQRWKWLLSTEATRDDGSRYATTTAEGLEWFGRFFDSVAASDLLMGRKGAWRADLAWLMKRGNFTKVVQGNYVNRETV